jgi:phospholipid/cholesterol/gamma-HCH transport system substrate-binding protein
MIARQQKWWTETFEVRFRTADATGIWPGVNVTLSGYRIGRVERVNLAPDGLVSVDLRIEERYRGLIGPASKAFRSQDGLIGETQVALSPDVLAPGEKPRRVDFLLPYDPGLDVAELLRDLARTEVKLNRTLTGTARIVEKDLPSSFTTVQGTLTDVRELARRMAKETESTAAVTRATLSTYQQTGQEVGLTSSEARQVLRDSAPTLAATLREIRTLAATTNRLLKGLGGTFLLDVSDDGKEGEADITPSRSQEPPTPSPGASGGNGQAPRHGGKPEGAQPRNQPSAPPS